MRHFLDISSVILEINYYRKMAQTVSYPGSKNVPAESVSITYGLIHPEHSDPDFQSVVNNSLIYTGSLHYPPTTKFLAHEEQIKPKTKTYN